MPGHPDRLEHQRRAGQIAARDRDAGAEHRAEIDHRPVVRGGGGREQPEVRRKGAGDAFKPPVIGPEIVPPVGNAVRFVDDQQHDARRDVRQDAGDETLVAEALGSDKQKVHLVAPQTPLHVPPLVLVVRRDPVGAEPHAPGGQRLVAHQREQRRDEQGGAVAGLAEHFGCDEVDEALSPPGLAHDEEPPAALDNVADRFLLPFAKPRPGQARAHAEQRQRAFGVVKRQTGSPIDDIPVAGPPTPAAGSPRS